VTFINAHDYKWPDYDIVGVMAFVDWAIPGETKGVILFSQSHPTPSDQSTLETSMAMRATVDMRVNDEKPATFRQELVEDLLALRTKFSGVIEEYDIYFLEPVSPCTEFVECSTSLQRKPGI